MDINLLMIILGVLIVIFLILAKIVHRKGLKVLFGSITCLFIIALSMTAFIPLLDKTNYGLDLKGGFEVLYEVTPLEDDQELNSDMVYNTYKAILKRIDILGVSEPEITIEGDNRIRIKLAGVTNAEEARDTISSTAVLSFRDANDNLLMTSSVLGGNAKVTTDQYGNPAVSLSIKDTDTFYNVTKKVKDMTNNVIVIWLDYETGDSYQREKDKCGSLGDSKCLSAATVNEAFASDVIIQGNFTQEEAESLVELINSGALPTKLTEITSRTVEATYGESSLNTTLFAGLIGLILVTAMMCIIYRFSGFITSMNVILYTLFTFIIFYLIGGVLTLPGIAAMLLGIGMAVDASVISFERIKEQLKIGKSLEEAFEEGNKESFTSIIDANATTIIAAIILFIFGQSSIKGFATVLIITIFVTIGIMVFFSRFVLKQFVKTKFFDDKPNFFIGLSKKKITKSKKLIIPFQKLEFVKTRKYFFALTIIVIVIGSIFLATNGLNLGVDFTGGTSITVNSNDEQIQKDIEEKYTIKKVDEANNSTTIVIEENLDKDEISTLANELETNYQVNTDIFVVSQIVKQELTKNAIYSLILASLGIVIYVSLRFKFNYAISGLIALLHDVIIIILFFAVFKLEVTSIFIAAILTIIGYSINDTIVTFDMIRENYKRYYKNNITKKEDLYDLVNNSVRQTLTRSILTTITTLLPVICLIFLGAREIVNFNIALFVGFIAGVYSSIFISNQLWLILETRRITKPKKEKKKDKDDDDEIEELQVKGVNC